MRTAPRLSDFPTQRNRLSRSGIGLSRHRTGVAVALAVGLLALMVGEFAEGDLLRGPFLTLAELPVGAYLFLAALPVGAYLVVNRPILGVMLIVASIAVETAFVYGGTTLTRLLGIGVAGAWLVHKIIKGETFQPLFTSGFLWASTLFLAWVMASMLWAEAPGAVRRGYIQLAQLILLAAMIVDVVRSYADARWLVRILILSGAVASALLLQDYAAGNVHAGFDLAGENGTPTLLVSLLPFAFYLFQAEERKRWRLLGVVYIVLAVITISMTRSRMNLLMLPPVFLVLSVETFRFKRGRSLLVAMLAGGIFLATTLVPKEQFREQAGSIIPYLSNTVINTEGSATAGRSGRGYHLAIGIAIFKDHPVIGAGYNNYGLLFRRNYQFQVSGSSYLYRSWRSPHSSHIGIMADLGSIGLALWLALLAVPLLGLIGALRRVRRQGSLADLSFTRAVFFAFLLQAIPYGFYGPTQQEKIFWVLLALAVIAERLVQRKNLQTESYAIPREAGT